MELSKIENLEKYIEYQQDSAVSKTVLKKKSGNITLFAFDAGQGLSEHTAPFDAMVVILDGKSEIRIDGELFDLEQGDSIIMPAGKPHSLHAPEKFKMMLIMIKEQDLVQLS
jgi:quercetin dioxygenase-like cupin family protein